MHYWCCSSTLGICQAPSVVTCLTVSSATQAPPPFPDIYNTNALILTHCSSLSETGSICTFWCPQERACYPLPVAIWGHLRNFTIHILRVTGLSSLPEASTLSHACNMHASYTPQQQHYVREFRLTLRCHWYISFLPTYSLMHLRFLPHGLRVAPSHHAVILIQAA